MRRPSWPYPVLLLVWLALGAVTVLGQEATPDEPAPKAAPRAAGPEPVREHEPIHLREKDGSLVPVLGYTLADFDELVNLRNQMARDLMRPRYTLERMQAAGEVAGEFARLTIEFEVLVNSAGWVRVPLRLGEGVLVKEAGYAGAGEHFLEFEGPAAGYVFWLRGEAEGRHRLVLEMLAPIGTVAAKKRLKLTAPRSTHSELKLRVGMAPLEAAVLGGAVLERPVPNGDGTATECLLRAIDGQFELTWGRASQKGVEATPDLEAVATLLSRVDGRNLRTEASFLVRSFSGKFKFDQFRVRLPQGATLLPFEQPGIVLEGPSGAAGGARIVKVQLVQPTAGPVEVRLLTERTHNPARRGERVELAGFEVLDAVRQWGYIGVQIAEDWRVLFDPLQAGVRRVENLPEALQQEDLAAGFEYSGQPCSLLAQVVPRETRIAVEPEYVVRVEANRAHLEARLKYKVSGAKVFSVEVDLRGWETDESHVGPANVVDQEQVIPQVVSPLSVPLVDPSKREFEVVIHAWRPIPPGAEKIDFWLPQPSAHTLGLASVLVLPADNVALTPQPEQMAGLKPQPLPGRFNLLPRQQEALSYVDDVDQGRFVAGFRIIPRSVTVHVHSQATIDERQGRVEQKLGYKIAYEPIDKLTLAVPRVLADANQIQVSVGGRELPLARVDDAQEEADVDEPDKPVLLRVALVDEQGKLAARIGACELVVRYPLPKEKLYRDATTLVDVPLLMPADGELVANELMVSAPPGIRLQYREGPFQVQEQPLLGSEEGGLRLAATEPTLTVPLVVQRQAERPGSSTVVERAWVQTHLGSDARQDRVVYRFTTSDPSFELTLPPEVLAREVEATLDGRPVAARLGADRKLLVGLAPEGGRKSYVLEVLYRFAVRESAGMLALDAPQLPAEIGVRRLYWQIIVPPTEHVVFAPQGFTSEFHWAWRGFYFGRKPVRDQFELETWCGLATPRREHFSARSNRYLYSRLGPAGRLEVLTASRTHLVFGASLVSLAGGLALIYLPRVRHVALLVAVLALAALALVYPEPAVVLLQAASLGLALALFGGVLERVVSRRRGRPVAPRRGSSSIIDRATLKPQPSVVAGAHSSTRTAAVALPISAPESKS